MRSFNILVISILISGCATSNYFVATGSRADGTVEVACNYDMFNICKHDGSPNGSSAAGQACRSWGYDGARSFGGYTNQPRYDGTGQVRILYQCYGDPEK